MSNIVSGSSIEMRAWRQFLVLAETLHFGLAAQQLNMTQPPLTQAIQLMESRLGVLLFDRTRRRVALTPAGHALVDPVRQLLTQAQKLPEVARSAQSGAVGCLRLGFVSTMGFGPLPGWLREFRAAEPTVTVTLREATTDVQMQALQRGDADAGFVLHAPGMDMPMTSLSTGIEPLVLAVPQPSGLSVGRLSLKKLLAQPLIIFPRVIAPSIYDEVLAFYHRHAVAPVIAQEAIQMQTIVNLVSAGFGVAWVPRSMMHLQRTGVTYRCVPDSWAPAAPRCETRLVWPDPAGPVVRRFVSFIASQLQGAR